MTRLFLHVSLFSSQS